MRHRIYYGVCRKWLVQALLIAAIILSGAVARADDRNLLPKYGSLPETKAQKAANAAFFSAIDKAYNGDRNKASMDLALRGWEYLQRQNLGDAMRRFNQAWLLNKRNGTAIWGMAAVNSSAGRSDESLKLFAEAEESLGGDLNFSIDYAKAIGKAAAASQNDTLLTDAFERFERIYMRAPQNTLNLDNWALTLFGAGRYADAWEKIKLIEANKGRVDPRFLQALGARMARPEK